jgi:GTP-binding protein
LLNALCNRRNLFKVSKVPGRTRTIVHVEARLDNRARLYLVDLPGFGFADVSKEAKKAWGKLIESFLENRETLHAVFVLVDIRRGMEVEESELLDFLARASIPMYLVATKIDRVKRAEQKPALHALRGESGLQVIGTSVKTRQGIDSLLDAVLQACGYKEER